MAEARELRGRGHGSLVTYSPKVFIPLTKLCRDVCHYCTFARPPRRGERAYMTADEVLAVARAGAAAGCHEALFTLGDKPELRYRAARDELAALGCETTLEYLGAHVPARARGDGPPSAREPGRHDAGGRGAPARGLRLAGPHARDHGRAARRARRPPLRLAGQAARGPPRDDRRGRRRAGAVHDGDPDRARRDAGGAPRCARSDPGAARAARPRAGGDRPELPREAGDEDGGASGALARGAPVDDRGRADRARGRDEHPGSAEPLVRGLPAAPRRGDRRLGRRLAGDGRPREPRGGVARGGAAAGGDALARPRARPAARDLSGVRGRPREVDGRGGRTGRASPDRRERLREGGHLGRGLGDPASSRFFAHPRGPPVTGSPAIERIAVQRTRGERECAPSVTTGGTPRWRASATREASARTTSPRSSRRAATIFAPS